MTTESFRASDLGATPGVIPYVEFHTGPRRMLTIDLVVGRGRALVKWYPVVSIDGRQYVVVPGPVSWEIPADRNVHVSVHLEGEVLGRAPASFILPPGEGREFLTYSNVSGSGSLAVASQTPRA